MKSLCAAMLLAAISVIAMPLSAADLTKGDVIDRLIDSYGGETNLRKLDAVQQFWKMHTPISNSDAHDYRKILLPDHLLVELTYPDRTEKRLITNHGAFNGFDDASFTTATDVQGDAMRLQLTRLYSPLTLRNLLPELTLRDDREFCVLTLECGSLQTDYLVNKQNWHIEKVSGTMQINGGQMQFLTEYSDFRMVNGVLMHFAENNFAGAMNTAKLELIHSDVGLSLTEDDFPVPNGI